MKRWSVLSVLFFLYALPQANAQLHWALDSTYGQYGMATPVTHSNGVWLHHMFASALQSDGKLVLAGTGNYSNSIEVVKLKADGTLDNTFNTRGHAVFNANGSFPWQFVGLKIDATGRILVGYYSLNPGNARFSVLCIRPDGTLDPTFGSAGKAEIGPALTGTEVSLSSFDIQPDGRIVLAGGGPDALSTTKYVIARLTAAGAPDPSFGTSGIVKCPYFIGINRHMVINVIKVQTDGKIIAAGTIPPGAQGTPDSIVMIRYKTNGNLDSAYGNNGIVRLAGNFRPGAIRQDIAGNTFVMSTRGLVGVPDSLYIHKYTANGTLITSFGTGGILAIKERFNIRNEHEQYTYPGRFELLQDGKMIVCGTSDSSATSDYRVMRLLADGTPDTSFATNGVITVARNGRDICTDMVLQADGRIILTGYYRTGEGSFDTARVLAMRFSQMVKPGTNSVGAAPALLQASVYPNPVNHGMCTLNYVNPGSAGPAQFSLVSLTGQEMKTGSFYLDHGRGSWTVRLEDIMAPGLYFLRVVTSEGKKEVVRLVKN